MGITHKSAKFWEKFDLFRVLVKEKVFDLKHTKSKALSDG